jgi:hypothetical protein
LLFQLKITINEYPGVHVVALKVENACDQVALKLVVQVENAIQRFLLPLVIR